MTNKSRTKQALFISALSLFLSFAMLLGTTYAWFTDTVSSSNNIIISGNLDVEMYWADGTEAVPTDVAGWNDASTGAIFNNDKWEPGYAVVRHIKIANVGNLALKYKVNILANGEVSDLADVIDVYYVDPAIQIADRTALTDANKLGTLTEALAGIDESGNGALKGGEADTITIALKMRETAGNEYQNKSIGTDFSIQLIATQLSYENDVFDDQYDKDAEYPSSVDEWDGTADYSWFLKDPEATTFTLDSAEALAGLSALVDGRAEMSTEVEYTLPEGFDYTFKDKTIILMTDVDLGLKEENGNPVLFDPIGDGSHDFSGVFDGNGHTIYNLRQDCNAQNVALFGAVYEGTVKNLIIDGALIENNGNGYAAAIAAYTGASTFEKITLRNTTVVNYNHNTGGIVGWCSNNGTTTTFDGINIESTTTIGSWWGSPDTRVGGIVGAMNTGNNIVIKNSTVACRLDVYNDVMANYQWGNYRMAGMLVGDVRDYETVDGRTQANPVRVTCENVTVIFGEWANYHYCESASYGKPSYADEGEYKFKRVESGLGYGGVDISACDHAADETHNELIEFTFLFGARDGKGIYGISEFENVTVIGNNAQ